MQITNLRSNDGVFNGKGSKKKEKQQNYNHRSLTNRNLTDALRCRCNLNDTAKKSLLKLK